MGFVSAIQNMMHLHEEQSSRHGARPKTSPYQRASKYRGSKMKGGKPKQVVSLLTGELIDKSKRRPKNYRHGPSEKAAARVRASAAFARTLGMTKHADRLEKTLHHRMGE